MQNTTFKDLFVLELASVLAGPAVGMFFAELGARVLKVENKCTGGDVTRSWKLPEEDAAATHSAYYHSVNWNKESIQLDLSDPADYQQLARWVKQADILIANFKAGADKKLKLDYQLLKKWNPRLIYAAVSAYGEKDPRPGFDAMIQAETGWVYMNGDPATPPAKMPVALMDILAAHQLKEGILVALLNREKTGIGCKVHVSLFDTGVASLANQASNWLNAGVLPERKGSQHPNIAPYGDIFYTKDDKPILLGTGTQRQFERLCAVLRLTELPDDPLFVSNSQRVANRDILNKQLKKAFLKVSFQDVYEKCISKGVTIAPVNNMQQLFELPAAKNLILEEKNEDGSTSKRVKTVVFSLNV